MGNGTNDVLAVIKRKSYLHVWADMLLKAYSLCAG